METQAGIFVKELHNIFVKFIIMSNCWYVNVQRINAGASLLFKSAKSTGNYHGDRNKSNFEKWLYEDPLRKLEKSTIIILDNVSFLKVIGF